MNRIVIRGKEVKDKCKYCGRITDCQLFLDSHGYNGERKRIAELIECQTRNVYEKHNAG